MSRAAVRKPGLAKLRAVRMNIINVNTNTSKEYQNQNNNQGIRQIISQARVKLSAEEVDQHEGIYNILGSLRT